MTMSARISRLLAGAVLTALAWMFAVTVTVHAVEASREVNGEFSSVRLLNGGEKDGAWQAGIYITLQPGWKTYWRVPGESGVPPQFDWSGSDNAADVAVAMPVPIRFSDGNGDGIGYKTEVVFPVNVKPADPARPVHLALKMFYAVCNDICVPVTADLKLDLTAETASASDRFRLGLAANDVPGEAAGQPVVVQTIRLVDPGNGMPVIEVTVGGLADPANVDIFAEAEGNAYFRKPELAGSSSGEAVYHLKIDGLADPASLKGKSLHLTIAAGGTNIAHEGLVQ
jgi:DsbC/DsbD-like thiol-disulfide interchange protein